MYLEIRKRQKKYYLDTMQDFNQEIIDDLGIENIGDICSKFERYQDVDDYDCGEVWVEFSEGFGVRAVYTDTKRFTLIEVLKNILDEVEVTEITKEFYDSVKDIQQVYKCENTIDLFEAKE